MTASTAVPERSEGFAFFGKKQILRAAPSEWQV